MALQNNFVFVFIYYSGNTIGSSKKFCIRIHLLFLWYNWLCQTILYLYSFTIVVILLALPNKLEFVFIYLLLWCYWLCQTIIISKAEEIVLVVIVNGMQLITCALYSTYLVPIFHYGIEISSHSNWNISENLFWETN